MEAKTIHQSGNGLDLGRLGLALLFLIAVLIYSYMTSNGVENHIFLVIAALFGGYMALNIGANDVANNVGPAVGSKALTMGGAILIAIIFEAGGAIIAGGDVVSTIKKGIISIDAFNGNTQDFILAMMSALLAAALWLNLATMASAPVSTTHSIVGGVMGAGIAAAGFSIVNWGTMGKIAASWIISPGIGGIIAAGFLFAITKTIVQRKDKISASKTWVPIYVALMSWAFVTYLILKGLKKVWPSIVSAVNENLFFTIEATKKPTLMMALTVGLIAAVLVFFWVRRSVRKRAPSLKNSRESVNLLFTIPLVFAAALLSFAHGANDVANAIGPLAAINDAVLHGGVSAKAGIPLWVMAVGAIGIAVGLALYGPKLIKTVGSEITELDQIRAFSIAMAAAITVIIASQLGLPVSSTHIAIGGVFGVGFLREWWDNARMKSEIKQDKKALKNEKSALKAYRKELKQLEKKENNSKADYQQIAKLYRQINKEEGKVKRAKQSLRTTEKVVHVKRDAIKKIITAWIITVPAAAAFSGLIFFILKGVLV